MIARIALLALVACKSKAAEPPPPPPPPPAAEPFVTADAAKLPGALYFVRDGTLVRLSGGVASTDFTDVGAAVFPSPHALPDGRVVGIASKGDGSAGGEQLVLIGPGSKVERVGPAATQIRSPAVDAQGAWIVVEARFDPFPSLYRIDLATQQHVRLTNQPKGDFTPARVGATGIAFASSRDGDSEIYRLDLATQAEQRLTAFHRDDWDPVPSPDGKRIAFVSDRTGRPRIFVVDADGTNLAQVSGFPADDAIDEADPVWSPDSRKLAFTGTRGGSVLLFVFDFPTHTRALLSPGGVRDHFATFSPDGAWIVVTRSPIAASVVPQLWAMSIASPDGWLPITRGPGAATLPRWHRQ